MLSIRVLWHSEGCIPCPLCGDEITRNNIVWDYRRLVDKRWVLLRGVGLERVVAFEWMAEQLGSRIGHFAVSAGRSIENLEYLNGLISTNGVFGLATN